jgi:hypothetical protein
MISIPSGPVVVSTVILDCWISILACCVVNGRVLSSPAAPPHLISSNSTLAQRVEGRTVSER